MQENNNSPNQILKLSDIARLTGAVITGNPEIEISKVAKIEEAQKGDLTFLYHNSYQKYFAGTQASAIFVKTGFEKTRNDIVYLETPDPGKAFLQILSGFFSPSFGLPESSATAFVHPSAKLHDTVKLGENVYVGPGCVIGKNTNLYHNTVLLNNVVIGDDCLLFPNVTVREQCVIGSRVVLHAGVVIGADGFGYAQGPDRKYIKIPQIGNVVIEDDVEIGANTTVDRAALGSTLIKRGTKLDNLVQIAHNVVIGEDTVISAQSGISGSSKIGNNCIIAGQVGIVGHIEIADNVIIGAQSGISKSITKPGMYFGYPAKEHRTALKTEAHIRNLAEYAERIKALEEKVKELESKRT